MSCCTCSSIVYAFIAAIVLRFVYKKFKANAAAESFSKKEKVVVITGCSSGIGADMAKQYSAQPGTKLVIAARRKEQLEQIKAECVAAGCANVTVVPTDVSKESDCKALIEAAVAAYGRIDVLILNAGIAQNYFFTAAQNTEMLRPIIEVNFWGCVWTAYYAFPHLCATKGRLGVVSSVLGHVTLPRTSLYNASKHALEGFFNTIRLEWRPSGVSVSLLNPGFIDTPMVAGEAVTASGKKEKDRGDNKTSRNVMPIKMMSSHDCAAALIKAVGARVPKAVVPGYYWILIHIYWLLPEVSDFVLSKMVGRPKKLEAKSN